MDKRATQTIKFLIIIVLMSLAAFFSCRPKIAEPRLIVYPSVYIPISQARETIIPFSQFTRLAVLNFVDQTGRASSLVETLADILSTELMLTGRFEIHDRGQLRYDDYTQIVNVLQKHEKHSEIRKEKDLKIQETKDLTFLKETFSNILDSVDALVIGSITSVTPNSLGVDIRIVNSQSFTVLYGVSATFPYQSGIAYKVDRDTVSIIARNIKDAFPSVSQIKYGKVIIQDGNIITVSMGKKDGVISGLNIFVVNPQSSTNAAGKELEKKDELYLAEAYVVSVFENSSKCIVFRGKDFMTGDSVRFK